MKLYRRVIEQYNWRPEGIVQDMDNLYSYGYGFSIGNFTPKLFLSFHIIIFFVLWI